MGSEQSLLCTSVRAGMPLGSSLSPDSVLSEHSFATLALYSASEHSDTPAVDCTRRAVTLQRLKQQRQRLCKVRSEVRPEVRASEPTPDEPHRVTCRPTIAKGITYSARFESMLVLLLS